MANRYLDRVRYQPRSPGGPGDIGGRPLGNSVPPAAPPSTGHPAGTSSASGGDDGGRRRVVLGRALLLGVIASLVAAVIGGVVVHIYEMTSKRLWPSPRYMGFVVPTAKDNLGAIKIERCQTSRCVEKLLTDVPGASRELSKYWNDDGGRVAIGAAATRARFLYVAEPRPTFESFYGGLHYNHGLAGLHAS